MSRFESRAVKTNAGAEASAFLHDEAQSKKVSEYDAWQRLIDYQLVEWGRNPRELEDDGLKAPAPVAIEKAIELSKRLRKTSSPAPTTIVPDGIGGIVFEYRHGGNAATLRISSSGAVEFVEFRDGALIKRWQVN
ncbi:MAG: hypothetical protein HY288_06995 [Planctomycetia bacterium]|nr:hypothetical protein [Planctomycetia bacterium]